VLDEAGEVLLDRKVIPGTHIGKLWRFRASDLNAWFAYNQRAS